MVIEDQVFSFLKCNFKKLPGEKPVIFPCGIFFFVSWMNVYQITVIPRKLSRPQKISVYVPGTWMVFDTIINSLLIPGFEIMILHWPVMKFVIPVLSPKLIGIKNFLFKAWICLKILSERTSTYRNSFNSQLKCMFL